jgi:hypothetical protein
MAVHCVPVKDDELLDCVESGTRLLIIGCPICANICYARDTERPIWSIDWKGINANSIRWEIERLSALFRQKGVEVSTYVRRIPLSLCLADNWGQSVLRKKAQSFDKILVMSCEAGQKAMGSLLGSPRIIGGMHANGLLRMDIDISCPKLRIYAVEGSGDVLASGETKRDV